MQGRTREHPYNLRKFIRRPVRFQHTDFQRWDKQIV